MAPIGVHFTTRQAKDPVTDVQNIRLWDNGVTWKDIAVGPGHYEWDLLDHLVFERYKGKNITYVLHATPQWAAQKPNAAHYAPWLGPGTNSLPKDWDHDFKPFVWELSTRYKNHINSYQIFNELQLVDFLAAEHWNDKGRNQAADLMKIAARIIKGNDPKSLIGSFPMLPRESSGGMKRAGKMLDAMQRRGAINSIDWWGCHIYPEIGKGRKRWTKYFNDVKNELKARKLPNAGKIRVTETLYGLLGPALPDEKIHQLVRDTYEHHPKTWLYWYAFDRVDLQGNGEGTGMQIDHGRTAWNAIKKYHNAF